MQGQKPRATAYDAEDEVVLQADCDHRTEKVPQPEQESLTPRAPPSRASVPTRTGWITCNATVAVICGTSRGDDGAKYARTERINRGIHKSDVHAQGRVDDRDQSGPERRRGTG